VLFGFSHFMFVSCFCIYFFYAKFLVFKLRLKFRRMLISVVVDFRCMCNGQRVVLMCILDCIGCFYHVLSDAIEAHALIDIICWCTGLIDVIGGCTL